MDTVQKILEFNKEKQKGQGLNIFTPCQMLNRLPISLARLNAIDNSAKLKNEIRQLLCSYWWLSVRVWRREIKNYKKAW